MRSYNSVLRLCLYLVLHWQFGWSKFVYLDSGSKADFDSLTNRCHSAFNPRNWTCITIHDEVRYEYSGGIWRTSFQSQGCYACGVQILNCEQCDQDTSVNDPKCNYAGTLITPIYYWNFGSCSDCGRPAPSYCVCNPGFSGASCQRTPIPTSQPTQQPSAHPSVQPSAIPTSQPTAQPSGKPTIRPSGQPSALPSTQPTSRPTSHPTAQPSNRPSPQPSASPTGSPTNPSSQPTSRPSCSPSSPPSGSPSSQPTVAPTGQPTPVPSSVPSSQPSANPSGQPTSWPTYSPTPAEKIVQYTVMGAPAMAGSMVIFGIITYYMLTCDRFLTGGPVLQNVVFWWWYRLTLNGADIATDIVLLVQLYQVCSYLRVVVSEQTNTNSPPLLSIDCSGDCSQDQKKYLVNAVVFTLSCIVIAISMVYNAWYLARHFHGNWFGARIVNPALAVVGSASEIPFQVGRYLRAGIQWWHEPQNQVALTLFCFIFIIHFFLAVCGAIVCFLCAGLFIAVVVTATAVYLLVGNAVVLILALTNIELLMFFGTTNYDPFVGLVSTFIQNALQFTIQLFLLIEMVVVFHEWPSVVQAVSLALGGWCVTSLFGSRWHLVRCRDDSNGFTAPVTTVATVTTGSGSGAEDPTAPVYVAEADIEMGVGGNKVVTVEAVAVYDQVPVNEERKEGN